MKSIEDPKFRKGLTNTAKVHFSCLENYKFLEYFKCNLLPDLVRHEQIDSFDWCSKNCLVFRFKSQLMARNKNIWKVNIMLYTYFYFIIIPAWLLDSYNRVNNIIRQYHIFHFDNFENYLKKVRFHLPKSKYTLNRLSFYF